MKKILLLLFLVFFINITFSQTNHFVQVSNYVFAPKDLTINIGDTVTWKWVEGSHTTTSDSSSGLNVWDAAITSGNSEFSFVLKSLGLHRYYCIPHGSPGGNGMAGTILVNDIVPVELGSFSVSYKVEYILLEWVTVTELNNNGFEVERKIDKSDWIKVGFLKGHGTSSVRRNYFFEDNEVFDPGKYYYRLKQIDFDGAFKYYNSKSIEVKRDHKFQLLQNYPNPFNPETSIRVQTPINSFITIRVYNLLGQELVELFTGYKDRGLHEFKFNGDEFITGIYLYKVEAKGEDGSSFSDTRKMTLLK